MYEKYMSLALELAKKGMGRVSPNPMVGCVVVKNGKIIGTGFHEEYGKFHAERNALLNCSEDPKGADLYVTLEPCCHYGKTPPCTEIIIESGIKRVIVGCTDPNPRVIGKGIEILEKSGIEVICGIMESECLSLNEIFFHFIKTGLPLVTLKYAMTMDGKIATSIGKSQWITGEKARENVHLDRMRHSAIMVGIGTVIADNPMLTCRMENGRNPIRIICDTELRLPLESNIAKTAKDIKTLVATGSTDLQKITALKELGIEIICLNLKDGHIDLQQLMTELSERKIDSVLLEGGSQLSFSALKSGVVKKVQAYIAPKIFGGQNAKTPVGGLGVDEIADCIRLTNQKISTFGQDILIESEVMPICLQE